MFRSLTILNYRIWFVGALVSNLGLWIQRIAQDWLVLTVLTHNSGIATGVTTGLQFLPQLFMAPIAGALSDRYSKQLILKWTQALMGATALLQGILVFTNTINLPWVFGLAFLLGIISAIDSPARQAFVSELVDRDHIANAVSLNSVSFNAARLIGPAFSGVLIQQVGIGWAFIVNVVTFIAMLAALQMLHQNDFIPVIVKKAQNLTLKAGMAYVKSRSDIVMLMCMISLVSGIALNFQVTVGLVARVIFDKNAADYGLLNTALALGSLSGALFGARVRTPRIRTIVIAAAGLGAGMTIAGFATSYWVFAVFLVLCGYCTLRMLNTANAYIQLTTEPEFRGRVMAIYLAVFLGATPIGSPLVGWLGTVFSPRWSFWVGAIASFLGVIIALTWALRNGRISAWQLVPGRAWLRRITRGRTVSVPSHAVDPDETIYAHPETGPITLPERREIRKHRKRKGNRRTAK